MLQVSGLTTDAAVEALSVSLETMAFVSLLPADEPSERPAEALYVRIGFVGDAVGALEVVVSRAMGRLLMANVIAGSDSPCTDAEADEALQEIVNIVCGRLLRSAGRFEMELPTAAALSTDEQWLEFIASKETIVLDAEGIQIALRLQVNEQAEQPEPIC